MHRHFFLGALALLGGAILSAQERPKRQLWTTSKVVGTPEPALPFVTEPIWETLPVSKPLELKSLPSRAGWMVYADHRETKEVISVLSAFRGVKGVKTQISSLTLANRLIYGFCFHPKFEENGFIFLHTSGPRRGAEAKNKFCRVERWTMDRKSLKVAPQSRLDIIQWESNGHDGGGVVFGNDGMLYITTGDGTSDSDVNVTGQRIDLLLSKVLRINVDQPANGKAYSIPPDNPFIKTPKAAPETWAHGFRNPWRITSDVKTGHIWVGENGQDLWESVKWLERGANYGWSKYEGSHPFYFERKLGPGKLTKPTFEHHHREARSLTGGVVYHGNKLPKLRGAYIYGDYATGKIWAGRHNGTKVTYHEEIADTSFAITGFAEDAEGNLIVIDERSGFHRFKPNPLAGKRPSFPRLLSETGLFQNTKKFAVASGVVGYSVNVPHWTGGADAAHHLAVPGQGQLTFAGGRGWGAAEGTVLMQTLSKNKRRVETRLLTKQQNEWVGYSYLWNEAQTDAKLVGADGLVLDDKSWAVPSRAECMMCHSRAARYTLSLTQLQMDRDHDFGGGKVNQIKWLTDRGILKGGKPGQSKLTNPYDATQPLEARVRSYWQVNCASCHVEAGGGNAQMELELSRTLEATRTVNASPVHSAFELGANASIVAPGRLDRSVMLRRIVSNGPERMPPVGGAGIDAEWVKLFSAWVSELKTPKK